MKSAATILMDHLPESAQWSLLLEYPIPRRQKRIDAIVLAGDVIVCLEFKTEDKTYSRQMQRQVEDYALDLRDFHDQSRDRRIVPIAVVLKADPVTSANSGTSSDPVRPVVLANAGNLSEKIASSFRTETDIASLAIDGAAWDSSAYRPVPTIIEAAEALFAGHNVLPDIDSLQMATALRFQSSKSQPCTWK